MPPPFHDLVGRLREHLSPPDEVVPRLPLLQPAAVVALLTEDHATQDPSTPRGDGPGIVFIERSSALRKHAGQIAFPGGKPESGDETLWRTAVREAEEEVGLEGEPEVLGRLGPVPTPTGFLIIPFVAIAPRGWAPRRASAEVARVLHPSLATLLDPGIHRVTGKVPWGGRMYDMHEFAIADPPLWGATARMVWDLVERIRGS